MLYYPHNIGDFSAATAGLDLESVGIFVRLVDRFMLTEKPIKTQWVSVGFPKESHEKVFAILDGLFERSEDGWIYPPLAEELERYRRTVEKNRENGRKGGRPRKAASLETPAVQASSVVTESPADEENQKKPTGNPVGGLTNNQQPTTNIEEANASSLGAQQKTTDRKRGTRFTLTALPEDWRAYCEKTEPDLDPELVFSEFSDYWSSVPGQKGLKLDWFATWRRYVNSFRNAEDWKRRPMLKSSAIPFDKNNRFKDRDHGLETEDSYDFIYR